MSQAKRAFPRPSSSRREIPKGAHLTDAEVDRVYRALGLDDETRQKMLEWSESGAAANRPKLSVVETAHTWSLSEEAERA